MQTQDTSYGYCQCGCGQKTRLAPHTATEKGWTRGEPIKYINGHRRRKHGFGYKIDPATGCWGWLGSKTWNGYGQGSLKGVHFLAHRWYYEKEHGPIPDGMALDHLCRNRACVNPAHLEPVTYAENARRGRNTRLTPKQVDEILNTPRGRGSGRALAAKFDVAECTISAIRCGRIWVGHSAGGDPGE